MRASPAFQVNILHFGLWRTAILLLLGAAAMSLGLWLASFPSERQLLWSVLALGVGSLLCLAAARLLRCAPMSLRWDTQSWHLGPVSRVGDEPLRGGRLAVAIDLGVWLLLRFQHDATNRRSRTTWVPVQRRGLEAHWHALRCAVYCARAAESGSGSPAALSTKSQE
jgi:hypothetical protein